MPGGRVYVRGPRYSRAGRARRWAALVFALAVLAGLVWAMTALYPRVHREAGERGPLAVLGIAKADPITPDAWTARFRARIEAGDWSGLSGDLDGIQGQYPALYRLYRLAYL